MGTSGIEWANVRSHVDIVRVATGLLGPPAKRQGRRMFWTCPFHEDRHPSFAVDVDRQTWKCWPCDLGGDAVELVKRLENLGFPEAARRVAELAGVVTPSGRAASPSRRSSPTPAANTPMKATWPPPERSTGLPLADALSLVSEATRRLWEPEGANALEYLHGRGLTDETIRQAHLGVVNRVEIPTRDGDRYYRARGVVIPWFDGDRLALVKIRQPEGVEPRYAEAFRDRPRIFPGPEAIKPGYPLVIVEGEFDALLLGQELQDAAAVVTLGGTGSNKPDPDILIELMPAAPWFLALDGDEAGDKAAANWPSRAIRVRPPAGVKDWTELWQAGSASVRYHWGRYLPLSVPWEILEPKGELATPSP